MVEHQGKNPSKNGEKPRPSRSRSVRPSSTSSSESQTVAVASREDMLPHLWSFGKGPSIPQRLENLGQVPLMAATLQELRIDGNFSELRKLFPDRHSRVDADSCTSNHHNGSLTTLSTRPPNLRLGISLPLSRVYAEYWAGSLELHSLEGYGVDAFLQISKLGNKKRTTGYTGRNGCRLGNWTGGSSDAKHV